MPSKEVRDRVRYKGIPEWPWFRVSSDGVVESCRQNGPGGFLTAEWCKLDGHANEDGYIEVKLSANGRDLLTRVHTLVLLAFVGPKPDGMQACHINGNRADNRLANLRWGTAKSNIDDREAHGNTARGERNGNAKVTSEIVQHIKDTRAAGKSFQRIADGYGVSKRQVMRIINGKSWKHLPQVQEAGK
jgi:hypothetical protein